MKEHKQIGSKKEELKKVYYRFLFREGVKLYYWFMNYRKENRGDYDAWVCSCGFVDFSMTGSKHDCAKTPKLREYWSLQPRGWLKLFQEGKITGKELIFLNEQWLKKHKPLSEIDKLAKDFGGEVL